MGWVRLLLLALCLFPLLQYKERSKMGLLILLLVSIVGLCLFQCLCLWSSVAYGVCRRGSSLLGRATGPAACPRTAPAAAPAVVVATAGIL